MRLLFVEVKTSTSASAMYIGICMYSIELGFYSQSLEHENDKCTFSCLSVYFLREIQSKHQSFSQERKEEQGK